MQKGFPLARKILRPSCVQGFSLVEVIISIGIVATVMLGLIGIMPAGMSQLLDAQRNTIENRIVQELISEAQSADWARADPSDPNAKAKLNLNEDVVGDRNVTFYDVHGNRISNDQRGRNGIISQYAAIVLTTDNPKYLGAPQGYKHLKQCRVLVEFTPNGRNPDFQAQSRQKFVREFPFIVANMGDADAIRED
jgi:uncharacterized protein (TIGR02598 family)